MFLNNPVPPCAAGSPVPAVTPSSENAAAFIQHPTSLSAKTKDRSATSSTGAEVKPSQGLQVPAGRTPAKHAKIGALEAEREEYHHTKSCSSQMENYWAKKWEMNSCCWRFVADRHDAVVPLREGRQEGSPGIIISFSRESSRDVQVAVKTSSFKVTNIK